MHKASHGSESPQPHSVQVPKSFLANAKGLLARISAVSETKRTIAQSSTANKLRETGDSDGHSSTHSGSSVPANETLHRKRQCIDNSDVSASPLAKRESSEVGVECAASSAAAVDSDTISDCINNSGLCNSDEVDNAASCSGANSTEIPSEPTLCAFPIVQLAPTFPSDGSMLPLCLCKISTGLKCDENPPKYCQAFDSMDRKVLGCTNKIVSSSLMRASVRVPFTVLCKQHIRRLKDHWCCPHCGVFCVQGKFYECRGSAYATVRHYFHLNCLGYGNTCPHCGSAKIQLVELSLNLTNKDYCTSALAATSRCALMKPSCPLDLQQSYGACLPEVPANAGSRDSMEVKLLANERTISSAFLSPGPDRDQLEGVLIALAKQRDDGNKLGNLEDLDEALLAAVQADDLTAIIRALDCGANANCRTSDEASCPALHLCAQRGRFLSAYVLLQAGADPNLLSGDLRTALMMAAELGDANSALVRLLIFGGAFLDARGEDGTTAMHIASRIGALEILKGMVEAKQVDVDLEDQGGWTPFFWACEHARVDVAKYLALRGAQPRRKDYEGNIAMHWVALSGSVELAAFLLDNLNAPLSDLAVQNIHGDTPLHIAARQGHLDLTQ